MTIIAKVRRWRESAEPCTSWFMLFCAAVPINILCSIENMAAGIYYVDFVEHMHASSASVGLIYSIKAATNSIFGMVTSSLLNKFGAQVVCISGGILYFAVFLISSFAPNIYVLYVTQGLMAGVALSLVYMTNGISMMQHFNNNRSLAAGSVVMGSSVGYLVSPFLVTYLIRVYGWRGSMVIIAAIMANIVALGALHKPPVIPEQSDADVVINNTNTSCLNVNSDDQENEKDLNEHQDHMFSKRHQCKTSDDNKSDDTRFYPEQLYQGSEPMSSSYSMLPCNANNSHEPTESSILSKGYLDLPNTHTNYLKKLIKDVFGLHLLKNYKFVILCISGMLGTYGHRLFLQHMPSKVISSGFSKDDAAAIMSIFSMTSLFSRIIVTLFANTRGVNRILLFGCGLLVGALANCLTLIHSFTGLAIAAATNGLQLAMTWTVINVILVDVLGIEKLAKGVALFYLFTELATLVSVPISGHIYDVTGNYDIPFVLAAVLGVIGGVMTIVFDLITNTRNKSQSNVIATVIMETVEDRAASEIPCDTQLVK